MRKTSVYSNREGVGVAPQREEVVESALSWAEEEGVHPKIARKAGNEYRVYIRKTCKAVEWPPCMGCDNTTVYYCQETGVECMPFRIYCHYGVDDEDNNERYSNNRRKVQSRRAIRAKSGK